MADWKKNPEGIEYMRWTEAPKEVRDKVPEEEHKHAEVGDFHFFTRKWKDGSIGMYRVPKADWKEELIKPKGGGGGYGGKGGGRPATLAAEDFMVATVDTEVRKALKEGWVFVVGEHGLQIGTMAVAGGRPDQPDVVNGLFMIKPKASQ